MLTTIDLETRPSVNGGRTMKFTFGPESKPLSGYTIKRAIQRGGFGEVYYALSDAGKEVALKLVHQNMDVELRGVSQCLNLKHTNLVTVFDIRTDTDGDHWVVMEYVTGRSLDQVLADHPRGLPVDDVQSWLSGIAAGVGFLHDRGIVHRDVKPANIYMENGVVKVGDMGLSKYISPSRRSAHTQSVGTVYYMAPEVARGRYGPEVDVYALAVILYEMLTGRVPFDGETTAEILMKHLSEPPDLSPVPERFRPLLAHALEKDPAKRTPNVAELDRDFRLALVDGPASHRVSVDTTAADAAEPTPTSPQSDTSRADRPFEATSKSRAASIRSRSIDPLTRFLHNVVDSIRAEFYAMPPWLRGLTIAVLVLFLLESSAIVIPFGMAAVLAYVAFRVIYGLFSDEVWTAHRDSRPNGWHHDSPWNTRHGDRSATQGYEAKSATATRPSGSVQTSARHASARRYHRSEILTPVTLRTMSLRRRTADLTGSMAVAVVCSVVLALGMHFFVSFPANPEATGFFAVTTILAAWAVMIPSKLCEGRAIDVFTRRLIQLVFGCLVGVAAYGLDTLLFVDLPRDSIAQNLGLLDTLGARPLYENAMQPSLTGYILFFGLLFFLRRWWWHADAFRRHRLRVSSLLLTTLAAFALAILLSFPSTWAMTWAAVISAVVQVSSVWMAPNQRHVITGGANV